MRSRIFDDDEPYVLLASDCPSNKPCGSILPFYLIAQLSIAETKHFDFISLPDHFRSTGS
jgi:hypothetical protein